MTNKSPTTRIFFGLRLHKKQIERLSLKAKESFAKQGKIDAAQEAPKEPYEAFKNTKENL